MLLNMYFQEFGHDFAGRDDLQQGQIFTWQSAYQYKMMSSNQ